MLWRALLGLPASLGTMDGTSSIPENPNSRGCGWVVLFGVKGCAALEVTCTPRVREVSRSTD